jgi:hypothetical protein
MYNKLFTKILDSSIWLAPDPHRLVWITLIAAMDRDGFAQFACIENLAARARVSVPETAAAIEAFLNPDPFDPSQEFEGRRVERVPGGWLILNAEKYRSMVTQAVASEQAKLRMQAFRKRKREQTLRTVTQLLRDVTPSESDAVAVVVSEAPKEERQSRAARATATRLPADWTLTSERFDYAKAQGLDPGKVFENFRDYWTAKSGQNARKHDWDATWRTWCRRESMSGRPGSKAPVKAKTVAELEREAADEQQRSLRI